MPPAASIPRENAVALIDLFRAEYARRAARTISGDARADALGDELRKVLALLDAVDFSRADETLLRSSGHPVLERLGALGGGGGTEVGSAAAGFATLLAKVRPWLAALPWRYSYDERADSPGLGGRMAWAELVGPIAPFVSERVCFGLTAIAPGVLYPAHRHPAVETYFVLNGTARWTAAGVACERAPGAFILHPSNIVHVMETSAEPLLAAYTWSGDVHTLSTYA
jgi:hypothetical protein